MTPRVQERVFGERTGCHDAHNFTPDYGLGTSFFSLGKGFGLFADRNPVAFSDQAVEIGLVAVDWDPAHGDIFSEMLAAFC